MGLSFLGEPLCDRSRLGCLFFCAAALFPRSGDYVIDLCAGLQPVPFDALTGWESRLYLYNMTIHLICHRECNLAVM